MFHNFVSLGPYCATAASMAKYGLRSWSGPFDWLITRSLKWILYFMDNDFEGFLEKGNLECLEDDPRTFKDRESGFCYIHDKEYSFEDQYDDLYRKYQRKIGRFLVETLKPTCYLRWIENLDEVEYVNKNYDYISSVIKKKNCRSEIVFVVRNDLGLTDSVLFRNYIMPELNLGTSRENLRGLFDNAGEFLEYCALNYSAESLIKNIMFDRKQEDQIQQSRIQNLEASKIAVQRYYLLAQLLEDCLDFALLPSRIVIYGAGNVGRLFSKKVQGKCDIVGFVDKAKAGQEIDGVLISSLDEIECDENVVYIVTPTYDFENICKDIRMQSRNGDKANIISLEDIFKK